MIRTFGLVATVLSLAACVPGSPSTQASRGPVQGFTCPPAGFRVDFSGGVTITSRGADPSDPTICLQNRVAGGTNSEPRILFHAWELPQDSESSIRRGMEALFPIAVGKSTSFSRLGPGGGVGQTQSYREVFTVEAREQIEVGNMRRDVWRIRRTSAFDASSGFGFRGELLAWRDVETFVTLRQQVVNGQWLPGNSFQATSMVLPAN